MEGRAGRLEDEEVRQTRRNGDVVRSTVVDNAGGRDILTVTNEGVGVGLTLDGHTGPLVLDDVDMDTRNVGILLQDVLGNLLGKHLNRVDIGAALGDDVDSVLAGV